MRTPWSDDPNSAGFSPEDVLKDSGFRIPFPESLKEVLADQVTAESVLLSWLNAHPSARVSGHRRLVLKTRRWLQAHRPVLHVGPCNHEDCY